MPPITNSTSMQQSPKVLCHYFNSTYKIQLIRLWNGRSYSLERIIFPQQRILFEAKPEETLKVHVKRNGKQLLKTIFICHSLQVKQSQHQLAVA